MEHLGESSAKSLLTGLARVPTIPGMDESERQALFAALDVARRDRQELDQLIGYLSRRLGVSEDDESAGQTRGTGGGQTPPDVIPSTLVADGEFFGMSATKATKALLNKLGRTRPLKTREIFDAIKKGGVNPATPDVLYKSLARSKDFELASKGTWGLSEWYGNRSRKSRRDPGNDESGSAEDGNPEETADSIGVHS